MKAVDVSNFTGVLPESDLDILADWGIVHAIVGTQNADVAIRQVVQFASLEISCDLYVQFDANNKVVPQFERAFEVLRKSAVYNPVLWIAVEQIASPWSGDALAYMDLLREAVLVARGLGFEELGIYTSASQWQNLTKDSDVYKDFPLWYANYDQVELLDARIWRQQGFGAWWQPSWKQYHAGEAGLGFPMPSGKRVDFDVSYSA